MEKSEKNESRGRKTLSCALFLLLSLLFVSVTAAKEQKSIPDILERTSSGDLVLVSGGIFRTSTSTIPHVKNATYNVAEGGFMGAHLRIPLINVDFDEPIFGLYADRWCVGCSHKKQMKMEKEKQKEEAEENKEEEEEEEEECVPCDYSKKDRGDCSKEARMVEKKEKEKQNQMKEKEEEKEKKRRKCRCEPSLFCKIDPQLNNFDEDYKLYDREWVELELGKEIKVTFQPPEAILYRIYAPDPCSYLRILVNPQLGYSAIVEVANERMWRKGLMQQRKKNNNNKNQVKDYISNPFLKLSLSGDVPPSSDLFVCPNDEYQLFEPGTYIIRVSVDSLTYSWWSYSLLVETIRKSLFTLLLSLRFASLCNFSSPSLSLSPLTSHHITSHHITSHHITSHHITSHHITSHHITSNHITSPFSSLLFSFLVYLFLPQSL
jgi:preprotein translocase subunit YajC